MSLPTSTLELRCRLQALVDCVSDPDHRRMLHQAAEEVVRATEAAAANGTMPSACESLLGLFFVSLLEGQGEPKLFSISEPTT